MIARKRYFLRSIFLAAIIAAVADPSLATDESYINMVSGIGAGYYYLYPKDTQVQPFYRGGIIYQGFAGVKAESGLSVIGDIGYYSEGNRSATAPYGTALTIIPVTVSAAYHFFKDSAISPYFGAGLGLYSIKEDDPDTTFLSATKFGKHVFTGLDIYFDRHTILRAELRQSFIDPVSNSLYYQASFGGLAATVNIATEWPIGGKSVVTPDQNSISNNEYRAIMNHLDNIDSYYYQQNWDRTIYQPWNSPAVYINVLSPPPLTQQQIDEQKAEAEKKKSDQRQKEQEYIQEKQKLRQQKKEQVNPSGN